MVELPAVGGKPDRPKRQPQQLAADKDFDCQVLRNLLGWLGIQALNPKRGDGQRGLGRSRWLIERTLSWLHQFPRLRIRSRSQT